MYVNTEVCLIFFSQGLHFLIQSEKEPTLLDSRVENFILEVEVCLKVSALLSRTYNQGIRSLSDEDAFDENTN